MVPHCWRWNEYSVRGLVLEGVFIFGAGVVLGAGLILLMCYLGSNHIAASMPVTRSQQPKGANETASGAAKPRPRKPVGISWNAYAQKLQAAIPKMSPEIRDRLQRKLYAGDN